VSIELLFVGQRLKVRLDGQRHNGRWAVGQVLLECLGVYASRHVVDMLLKVVNDRRQ
jgi:hypothetical protein